MSEERTQAPTKRRRQMARERGQVARSGELTTAAGLLTAAVFLGIWGGALANGLIELIQAPLTADTPLITADSSEIVSRLRVAAGAVLAPFLGLAASVVVVIVGTHQVQVGGLWAPGLLAPDPTRLAVGWGGGDPVARLARSILAVVKSILVVGLTAWFLYRDAPTLQRLASLEPSALAATAARCVMSSLRALAVVMLALGGIDYLLAWSRVEDQLRQSPDEYREDLKALDGDPALRARRRKLALSWRRDAAEILPGAVLCLLGSNGLSVLLAGGPPPKRVMVRHVARGAEATLLRREAERAGIPLVEAPALASFFGRARASGEALPADFAQALRGIWPKN